MRHEARRKEETLLIIFSWLRRKSSVGLKKLEFSRVFYCQKKPSPDLTSGAKQGT